MLRPKALLSAGLIAVASLSAVLSGCSVGVFSDGKDKAVLEQKPYRPVNPACAQIDIQNSGVSVSQFRGLLGCLNANGSLEPIQKLTDQLSDEELLPLVRVGNEQFFKNPVYLYQFQQTYAQWVRSGRFEQDLQAVGALLRNEKWLTSVLALMAKSDRRIYPALKLISENWDRATIEKFLNSMLAGIEAPAFSSLVHQLSQAGRDPHSREDLARAILEYVRAQRDPGRVDVDRRVLESLASGKLFRVLDEFSSSIASEGGIRITAAKLAALTRSLSAPEPTLFSRGDAGLLRAIMKLIHGLHAPIPCLNGTQTVPDNVHYIFGELASRSTLDADRFLRRDNVLNMSLVNSFCDYPKALSDHYSAFQKLASTDVLFTATEMSKAFYRNGIAELLIDTLGGEGVGPGVGSALESPVLELLPVMAELDDRGAFEDLILWVGSIRVQDRPSWQSAIGFLVQSRSELDGLSIYDVLYSALAQSDSELIESLLESFGEFLDLDQPIWAPALRSLRHSYLMNNVHPILDRFQFLLSSPELNQDFFESVFLMARKWPTEFSKAIRFLGQMTLQEDGRFKEVLDVTVRIFSKFSERGSSSGAVVELPVPHLESSEIRSHSWSRADLEQVSPQPLRDWRGCEGLTPGMRLDLYESPGYENLVRRYLECMDSDGTHGELIQNVFEYLLRHRLPNGRVMLHQLIDAARAMSLSPEGIRQGLRGFFSLYDDGRLFRAIDALPWWLTKKFDATREGTPSGTFVQALFDAISKTLSGEKESLAMMEQTLSKLLKSESFPGALKHALEMSRVSSTVTPFSDHEIPDVSPFSEVLSRYECLQDSGAQRQRALQLFEDYRHSVVGWNLDPATSRPPRSWDPNVLKAEIQPVLEKLADPKQGFLAEGLAQFMRTLSLKPGETPTEGRLRDWTALRDWLSIRANDWRVIPYFYPNEKLPRAKVVSSLDLLELLLLNANFEFIFSDNYALKFLTIVALAWGDEPREVWPPLIQQMYPGRKRPLTLQEAYEEILGTLKISETFIGYPKLPKCNGGVSWSGLFPDWVEARVFNMRQLVPVIEEALPGASGPRAGGMRILRDLLFSIYQSTPEKDRSYSSGWKNNLSFSVRLAELGAFRQISRGVRLAQLEENQGPAEGRALYSNVIEGFVKGLGGPQAANLIRGLVRNDPQHGFFFTLWDEGSRVLSDPELGPRFSESVLYGLGALRSPTLSLSLMRGLSQALTQSRASLQQLLPDAVNLLAADSIRSWLRALSGASPDPDFEKVAQLLLSDIGSPLKIIGKVYEPQNLSSWQSAWDRWEQLSSDPEYQDLEVSVLFKDLASFMAEEDRGSAQAARELRQFFADRCEKGEATLWLEAISEDSAGMSRLLESVGKTSLSGELKDLMRTFRKALPDPRRLTLDSLGLENRPHVYSHH